MLLKYAENIDENGIRLAWNLIPVLQYSSEFKRYSHDWLWTHGLFDKNGIILDTTDNIYIQLLGKKKPWRLWPDT